MAPRQRPAAALSAAERARNVQIVVASPVQTFGPLVLVSAAVCPSTQRQSYDRLVTLGLFWRTYRPGRNSWEALDGVIIALLNHQFLDGKCSDLKTQLITACSHVYPGLARRSRAYRPHARRAARAGGGQAQVRALLPLTKT